jgi:hypothetical protein
MSQSKRKKSKSVPNFHEPQEGQHHAQPTPQSSPTEEASE